MIRDMNTWKDLLLAGMAVLLLSACGSSDEEIVPEEPQGPTVPPLVTDYQDPMFENFECYPEGTVWEVMYYYYDDSNPDYCVIWRYEVKGDTTINDINYKKVLADIVRNDTVFLDKDERENPWGIYDREKNPELYEFFIREDKGRIYKYNPYFDKDALYYDFNWAEETEYWEYNEWGDYYDPREMVEADGRDYDSLLVNEGKYRMRGIEKFKMENGEEYDRYEYQIKTIGVYLHGGPFMPVTIYGDFSQHHLLSFYRNGELIYRNHNLDRYFENKENDNEQGN